jgi:hypothetical protein
LRREIGSLAMVVPEQLRSFSGVTHYKLTSMSVPARIRWAPLAPGPGNDRLGMLIAKASIAGGRNRQRAADCTLAIGEPKLLRLEERIMNLRWLFNLGIAAVALSASLVLVDDASGCRHRRQRRCGHHGGGYAYGGSNCGGSYYGGGGAYYSNGYAPYGNSKGYGTQGYGAPGYGAPGYDVAPPAPGGSNAPPAPTATEAAPAPVPGEAQETLETDTRSFSDQAAEVPPVPPTDDAAAPVQNAAPAENAVPVDNRVEGSVEGNAEAVETEEATVPR